MCLIIVNLVFEIKHTLNRIHFEITHSIKVLYILDAMTYKEWNQITNLNIIHCRKIAIFVIVHFVALKSIMANAKIMIKAKITIAWQWLFLCLLL